MKKEEKTEKENTARSMSEEKSSPGDVKEEKKEQSSSRSSGNNGESTPKDLSKKNHNFVRISGKKMLFTFCLIVVILTTGFGYIYRDHLKTVLPGEIVEFFTGSSQIAKTDTQESIQNEMGIDEMEKQDINSNISDPSIEEPASDQTDFSASDHPEIGSSLRSVNEAQLVPKNEKLEDDEILHSEKVSSEGIHRDVSEDHEKTSKEDNSDILAIVKELHKITVEIEDIDFTKNFPVEDNPALSADYSNSEAFPEKLLESLKNLIQIRKIKDYESLAMTQDREKSLKNQFVINLISGKTMLITGLYAEALDDIKRARKILNLINAGDEEKVTMMIGKLDKIIYQVKEMD